jgi:hypothetical protein
MSCVMSYPTDVVVPLCTPGGCFEKTLVGGPLSVEVSTSTAASEGEEEDEERFPYTVSSQLLGHFDSEDQQFRNAECQQQPSPPEDPQLGGAAAGPVSGGILSACGRQQTGEALWECVQAALLAMKHGCHSPEGDNSIVIFDWDDTLFPTTHLNMSGSLLSPCDADRTELVPCALAACELLRTAKHYGKVVIVTNAISGWVHEMVARFAPLLEQELVDVPVISARSIYEPQGISDTSKWKQLCFQRVVQCLISSPGASPIKGLVSIGDSWYERLAILHTAEQLGRTCHVKSLKFLTLPSAQDIARQVNFCTILFSWLMNHEGSLDLWLDPCGNVQAVTDAVLSGLHSESFGSMGPLFRDASKGD